MRKANLIPLAILLGVLSFTLWNSAAVSKASDRWHAQLQSAAALAHTGNWPAAAEALQESYADWSSHQTWLHIITQHAIANDAEAMYHRAMAFAATEEPSEFQAEMSDLMSQILLLAETERLRIGNIL